MRQPLRVLIVEDSEDDAQLLIRMLGKDGFDSVHERVETAVACMRSGAQDYIMKGNLSRLVPAVERELKEADQEERIQKEKRGLNLP